jgi:outer membrane protein TolC
VTAASILLEVREAFLTHLSEKALLGVAEETVKSFEKHFKEAETLVQVGKGTEADVAKARVDHANAKLELIRARNRVQISRLRLNKSMGLEDDPGYDVVGEIPKSQFNIGIEDAVKQARLDRPELKASWDRFRAAEESFKRAWADYLPSISLGASYDFSGKSFPLLNAWRIGPALVLTIFNGFQIPERIKETEALLRVGRAELANVEQKIYQEVQAAWLNLAESEERLKLAAETIKAAQESLRLTAGRYLVGRSTILEQTDAELALSKARAEEIRARYDYELNVVRLLRAVGIARPEDKKK